MPSPFPGMDPYLENPADWPGAHLLLISASAGLLNTQLKPRGYYVKPDERIWLEDPSTTARPDLTIIERPQSQRKTMGALTADEPIKIKVLPLEVHEAYLEIFDSKGRQLITAVEFISPSNKARGRGRESYRGKRRERKKAGVRLVEIDLLRAGQHLVDVPKSSLASLGPWHYLVNVVRARHRDREVYPISMHQRLARIRIPLKPNDKDGVLDLQAALDEAYDKGPFSDDLDYNVEPTPPLKPADAEWADTILRQKGFRK